MSMLGASPIAAIAAAVLIVAPAAPPSGDPPAPKRPPIIALIPCAPKPEPTRRPSYRPVH